MEDCTEKILEGVLRERMEVFIPSSLASFCIFFKSFTTRSAIPLGRRFFNFRYGPRRPVQAV